MVSDFIVHLLRSWVNSITFLKSSKRFNKIYKIQYNNNNHVISKIFQEYPKLEKGKKVSFYLILYICIAGKKKPGARLLKASETFRTRRATAKCRTLRLQSCFILIFFHMKRGSLLTKSFRRIDVSVISFRWTKNGSTVSKSFRGFGEAGPWLLYLPTQIRSKEKVSRVVNQISLTP